MIPKIAHFHWQGGPMSWLRACALLSFEKFNPDWEIRLIRTHPDVPRILTYAQQADWSWYKTLVQHGGFQVATDIVFVKPIPEEWLDTPLNVCTKGGSSVYQFAAMGCTPGHPYFVEIDKACHRVVDTSPGTLGYQSLGVDILRVHPVPAEHFDQPMAALCPYSDWRINDMWETQELTLPEEAIGLHWYGGHPISKQMEYGDPEMLRNTQVGKLALKVLGQ